MEVLLYLLLGATTGVLAGLFGFGGIVIIVLVLTQLAVGASLATIVFTSINSLLEHQRKGAVLWPVSI